MQVYFLIIEKAHKTAIVLYALNCFYYCTTRTSKPLRYSPSEKLALTG